MKKRKNNKGQGLVEYVIVLALISMVVVGGLMITGENTGSVYGDVATALPGDGTPQPTEIPSEIKVQVQTASGENLENVRVIAFNAAEEETGNAETDANGLATFSDLDAGRYVFRADYRGQGYWSETVTTPQDTQTIITITERQVQVYVIDANGRTLEDVPVYAFTGDEDYTGNKGKTDQNGSVTFTLPDGEYKFRADYQAQATWSETIDTRQNSSVHIRIPIAEFTVRVYRRSGDAVADVPVYAFNEDGGYTGIKVRTDSNGAAVMELPSGEYKFRADYDGSAYWSDEITVPKVNSTSLYVGGYDVTVRVTDANGNVIPNKMVYVYDEDGQYLKKGKSTDQNGSVTFELNEGAYRFRATDESRDFWSDEIEVPDATNAVIKIQSDDFTVTVTDRRNNPSSGVGVYVFRYRRHKHNTYYEYTGLSKYSDENGQASFDLSDGEYIILAYDFSRGDYEWSKKIEIPGQDSVTVRIR